MSILGHRCMHVSMYIRISVCMCVCLCLSPCLYTCMYVVCISASQFVCLLASRYMPMYVLIMSIYPCTYVPMWVFDLVCLCTCVSMFARSYVPICLSTSIQLPTYVSMYLRTPTRACAYCDLMWGNAGIPWSCGGQVMNSTWLPRTNTLISYGGPLAAS
jgi:hypothetical protein